MTTLVIAIILSYLLGSVPVSFLVTRITKGVDIRKYGSGNVGATNVLRTAGKAPALIALIGDVLKGVIAVTLLAKITYPVSGIIDYDSFRILLGLSVICGHIWPVFLGFKGGKGVATTTGVLLFICPKALGVAAFVWILTVIVTKYVSLGSLLGSLALPIVTAIMGKSIQLVIFTITLCIISSYKHKTNIIRLINGEEPKIGQKIQ